MSQYSTKKLYLVLNPDEDTFILRGWEHNPKTKGKTLYFVCNEERYGDKLLHCTVEIKKAKSFATMKEVIFYDPETIPEHEPNKERNAIVEVIHIWFQHESANDMKNLLKL